MPVEQQVKDYYADMKISNDNNENLQLLWHIRKREEYIDHSGEQCDFQSVLTVNGKV